MGTQTTQASKMLKAETIKWQDRHEKWAYWVRLENEKGERVEISIGESNYNKINALNGNQKLQS